jgi:hypothetical protein
MAFNGKPCTDSAIIVRILLLSVVSPHLMHLGPGYTTPCTGVNTGAVVSVTVEVVVVAVVDVLLVAVVAVAVVVVELTVVVVDVVAVAVVVVEETVVVVVAVVVVVTVLVGVEVGVEVAVVEMHVFSNSGQHFPLNIFHHSRSEVSRSSME